MIALLVAGCAGSGSPPDTGAPADPCAQEPVGASGLAVGEADCADGTCEIPAGPFWMGMADPDTPDACPARLVTLSAYAIDRTEVTRAAWDACVADGACEPIPAHCRSEVPDQDASLQPAICITWEQAAGYCAWAGGRLPTEAEWEKAARGLEAAEWSWGPDHPTCNLANHRFAVSWCELGVVEVGSYPDGPAGPCEARVIRGGAFNATETASRSAARSFEAPDICDVNLGFRCAWDR